MRVRNIYTGIVCDKTKDELSVFPNMYEIVEESTPLTQEKCCGEDGTIEHEDNSASLKEEKKNA